MEIRWARGFHLLLLLPFMWFADKAPVPMSNSTIFQPWALVLYCRLTSESPQININSKLLRLANLNFTSLLTHNPVRTFLLYRVSAPGGFSSQAIEINYSD